MGYIVLAEQLDTMRALTSSEQLDSIELVWLPDCIQVVVWDEVGTAITYKINEDGVLI